MPRIPRRSEGGEEQTQVTPPESTEKPDLSEAPPVTPASTAAPSEAQVAPGDASTASATEDAAPAPADSGEQPTVAAPPVDPPTDAQPTSGVPPSLAQPAPDTGDVDAHEGEQAPLDARPRFRQRTRMRRRLRYLRRLRELAFRDLGGLVFDLHRFGRERTDLVEAKLQALTKIDRELRLLEDGLRDRRDFTDLREAGIAACPRCGTLHDSDANYCPGCGSTLRSVLVREAFPVTVTPAEAGQQQQQQEQDHQPQPPQSTPAS